MKHTEHRAERSETRPFTGPICGAPRNRAADGCHRIRETCSCGAVREINVNGRHDEVGPWDLTEVQQAEARRAASIRRNELLTASARGVIERLGLRVRSVQSPLRCGSTVVVESHKRVTTTTLEAIEMAGRGDDLTSHVYRLIAGDIRRRF